MRAAGGFPLEFGTITVSDGISMGHEGMRASLVSREVIADSVECVMHAERLDGLVGLAGCDKSMPGDADGGGPAQPAVRVPLRRLDHAGRPERHGARHRQRVRGGRRLRCGHDHRGRARTRSRSNACPGEGACGGMFTANTMARSARRSACRCPARASPPAVDRRRDDDARRAGEAVVNMLRLGIPPRDIMTKEAFENAIAVTSALGGSTNAVLHLLAIANEAGVDLELDDFNRIAAKVPHIADTKPHGKYHMIDVDRIGGVPVVIKHLLEAGLLHGDVITVTGKTMAENLAEIDPPAPDGEVVHPLDAPDPRRGRHRRAHRLAGPEGRRGEGRRPHAEQMQFEGPARVFDGEDGAMEAILARRDQPGHVIVIRYEGPKGGPGMREMLAITGAIKGAGRGSRRRAHHRRSLLRRHVGLLHRPRRARGGRRRADRVRARRRPDPHRRADAHDRPAGRRRRARSAATAGQPNPPRYTSGVLAKYAKLAQGAENGAITNTL